MDFFKPHARVSLGEIILHSLSQLKDSDEETTDLFRNRIYLEAYRLAIQDPLVWGVDTKEKYQLLRHAQDCAESIALREATLLSALLLSDDEARRGAFAEIGIALAEVHGLYEELQALPLKIFNSGIDGSLDNIFRESFQCICETVLPWSMTGEIRTDFIALATIYALDNPTAWQVGNDDDIYFSLAGLLDMVEDYRQDRNLAVSLRVGYGDMCDDLEQRMTAMHFMQQKLSHFNRELENRNVTSS